MQVILNTYLIQMLEQKSEATVCGHKSSLSTFLNFVDVTEPTHLLVKDVVRFRYAMYEAKESWHGYQQLIDTSPSKQVKLLTEVEAFPKWIDEQQQDLLVRLIHSKYLAGEKKSYRELAIVFLMLKAGLRVGEVVGLKWDEIQMHVDKGKMLVSGKGQQQRSVPMIPELVDVLQKYKNHHGVKGEYVFY